MIQKWRKLGRIFDVNDLGLGISHSSVPFCMGSKDGIYQIYYSARDRDNRSSLYSFLFDLPNCSILEASSIPILEPGDPGTFDEDGVMGCHLYEFGGHRYLYYIGWNRGCNVPFRNAIGIAVESKGIFKKMFAGPILDRSRFDPCFVASCHVVPISDSLLVMYYLSGLKWQWTANGWKHFYHIKIASSIDGINWHREGKIAIDFKYPEEYAISCPRILFEDAKFRMWYSYRGGPVSEKYRIGYAESIDGYDWCRKDDHIKLDVSEEGWDSEMLCYPYIFKFDGNLYMLYNGNNYGGSGVGLAMYYRD